MADTSPPGGGRITGQGIWWERRWWGVLLVFATALPLVWPAIPPLLDLPAHMGRYHIALNHSSSAELQRYYDYDWHLIGNLGVDLLMVPIGSLVGIEAGTKIIAVAIPVMMACGFLWTAYQVHGRLPATAPLALVFVYAYPFHYGFINYCLGLALASLAFGLWIYLSDSNRLARAMLFAAAAVVIWIAHAVSWSLFCVLCGTYELSRQLAQNPSSRWRALVGTATATLPLAAPLVIMVLAPRSAPLELAGWLEPRVLGKWLLALNRDRWIAYDLACTLVLTGVIALAVGRRFGLSINAALGWPALALFGLFVLAPDSVNGSAMVNGRIAPWAAAYALLAVDTQRGGHAVRRRWAIFAAGFFATRMAMTTASLLLYSEAHHRILEALDTVPRGSAVAVLARNPCQSTLSNWANPRVQHLGSLAIVRRDAFVNDQWDAQALQLLTIHHPAAEPFTHSPSEVVSTERCEGGIPRFVDDAIDELPRETFDFVWLLDIPPDRVRSKPWLRPVHSTPDSTLYAIDENSPSSLSLLAGRRRLGDTERPGLGSRPHGQVQ